MLFVKAICFLISTPLMCSIAMGCMMSRGTENLRETFDRNLYVFVGEVVAEAEAVEYKNEIQNVNGKARGVKVKPVDIIHVPSPTTDYYEFFRFGVTSWCADKGMDWTYPVGTKLLIIAREAYLVPNRSRDGHIRLQSRMIERTSVEYPTAPFSTSSSEVYDYSKKLPLYLFQPKTDNDYALRPAFSDFYYVEVSKDLLRLESAKNEGERLATLKRLLYCPTVDFNRLVDPTHDFPPFKDPQTGKPMWKRQKGTKKLSKEEKRLIKERDRLEEQNLLPDPRPLQ